jgi:hypothetical protein
MLTPPFELIDCGWPLPAELDGGQWVGEPSWDAPRMPSRPLPHWEEIDGELLWLIDWRAFFHADLKVAPDHQAGEMREFYVTFRVRVHQHGVLAFWDDDGSIIRRAGVVVHHDRTAHVSKLRHRRNCSAPRFFSPSKSRCLRPWNSPMGRR